ncbi:hypothetical protein LCGC14_1382800 [marine sediment metagenome]|uniref:Uncharacterized protein n=1 Tax=marine sediment metagenome TaxID=412755 RepID=A0A0F9KMZ7_9ZZZZ
MNEIEDIEEIEEEEITEEEQQKQEIKELVGDIQAENKELYDILKTTLYKTLFQVFSRVTLKIEIVNYPKIEQSSNSGKTSVKNVPEKVKSNSSGNKSTTTKKEKIPDFILENVELKHETEKAYLFENVDYKVAWFPKKTVKSMDVVKKTAVIHGWFVSKIEWNDSEPFDQ